MTNVETNCLLGREVLEFPKLWPTATAVQSGGTPEMHQARKMKSFNAVNPKVTDLAMITEMFPNSSPSSRPVRTIGTHGLSAFYSTPVVRQLSPRFTFWLIGWPTTVLPGLDLPGMGYAPYKQRMRSQLYGLLSSMAGVQCE